jgi:hypothetical protein
VGLWAKGGREEERDRERERERRLQHKQGLRKRGGACSLPEVGGGGFDVLFVCDSLHPCDRA